MKITTESFYDHSKETMELSAFVTHSLEETALGGRLENLDRTVSNLINLVSVLTDKLVENNLVPLDDIADALTFYGKITK